MKITTIDSCIDVGKFPRKLYQDAILSLSNEFDWLKQAGFGEIICNVRNLTNSQCKKVVDKILSSDVVMSYGNFSGEPNEFLKTVLKVGYERKVENVVYIDFGHYLEDALRWIGKDLLEYALESNVFRVREKNNFRTLNINDYFPISE